MGNEPSAPAAPASEELADEYSLLETLEELRYPRHRQRTM